MLRNEYVTCGIPAAPDAILTEIVDEVFLPLVRGRGQAEGTSASGQASNIS